MAFPIYSTGGRQAGLVTPPSRGLRTVTRQCNATEGPSPSLNTEAARNTAGHRRGKASPESSSGSSRERRQYSRVPAGGGARRRLRQRRHLRLFLGQRDCAGGCNPRPKHGLEFNWTACNGSSIRSTGAYPDSLERHSAREEMGCFCHGSTILLFAQGDLGCARASGRGQPLMMRCEFAAGGRMGIPAGALQALQMFL